MYAYKPCIIRKLLPVVFHLKSCRSRWSRGPCPSYAYGKSYSGRSNRPYSKTLTASRSASSALTSSNSSAFYGCPCESSLPASTRALQSGHWSEFFLFPLYHTNKTNLALSIFELQPLAGKLFNLNALFRFCMHLIFGSENPVIAYIVTCLWHAKSLFYVSTMSPRNFSAHYHQSKTLQATHCLPELFPWQWLWPRFPASHS